MDFTDILNDVCSDNRVTTGIPNLKDSEFCFVLQEYLIKHGLDLNEVVNKTSMLFEKGKFPERQAYNKDGILVTFPTKEYRDRAVDKGTHSVENPKKANANIFQNLNSDDGLSVSDIKKQKSDVNDDGMSDEFISLDDYIKNNTESDDRSDLEKQKDLKIVSNILKNDDSITLEEDLDIFEKVGNSWRDEFGNLIAEQYVDDVDGISKIKLAEKLSMSQISTMNFQELLRIGKIGQTSGITKFSLNLKRMGSTLLENGLKFEDINDIDGLTNIKHFLDSGEYDVPENVIQWFNQLISLKKKNPSLDTSELKVLFDRTSPPFEIKSEFSKPEKKSTKNSDRKSSTGNAYKKLMDAVTRGEVAVIRTSVYETIPVLRAMGITSDDIDTNAGQNKILSALKNEEFQKISVDWFKSIINSKKKNPNLTMEDFKEMFDKVGGYRSDEEDVDDENVNKLLNDINGNIDSFVHKRIGTYKSILRNKTNVENDSKENTADIVLIYGTSDTDEFFDKLNGIRSEQDLTVHENGVIDIKNTGISFCQISLKADKGRIGKVTKKYASMIGSSKDFINEQKEELLNEGISSTMNGFIKFIKNKITNLSEKSKNIYEYFITKLSSYSENLLSTFRKIDVQFIQRKNESIQADIDGILNDIDNYSDTSTKNDENEDELQEYDLLSEKSNDVQITDCLYKKFKIFYENYKKQNFGDLINSFNTLEDYKNIGGLLIKVDDINEEENRKIMSDIEDLNNIFEDAYSKIKDSNLKEVQNKCIETGVTLSREQIGPIIKYRANYISLLSLHELFKKLIGNSSNLSVDEESIPRVASIFAAEAIFGDNLNLPLYKFDGTNLIYFGTKQSYQTKKEESFKELSTDGKLPMSILNVYSVKKEASHFTISLYLIHDFILKESEIEPEYIELSFLAGSGSKFQFVIESSKIVPYVTIKKKFLN